MRSRIAIPASLVICTAIAIVAWYQGCPRHFVVDGGTLGVGAQSKADPTAYIIWHGASIQPPEFDLRIEAFVKDVPGATIRCDLPDFPGQGGAQELRGDSTGVNLLSWDYIKIDRATMIGCVLGLRNAPKYRLDYATPRLYGWSALSIAALITGPLLAIAIRATANLQRRLGTARRGFEVLETPGRRESQ